MRPSRAGLALWTMTVVLALLAVFTAIAGRLFISSIRVTAAAQEIQTQTTRLDGLVDVLRADVWGAAELKMADGKLWITDGDGRGVAWQVSGDQSIVRTDLSGQAPVERRWPSLGVDVVLDTRDAAVVVRVSEGPVKRPIEQVLVSQLQLIWRAGR